MYSKSPAVADRLGEHVGRMLLQMAGRGPDSAGVAVYRDPVEASHAKLSLHAPAGAGDWSTAIAALDGALGVDRSDVLDAQHARIDVRAEAEVAQAWIAEALPEIQVTSAGRMIEIYKDAVHPAEFVERFGIAGMRVSHALGHTRMATESKVTPEGSHPFSTGLDLCLVHNGSLSNHNRLRA